MGTDYLCEQCDAEYQVIHREKDPVSFCPFCGWQKDLDEETEEDEELWDDE
jgi:rRNA maturation endonuclease Nob1